MMLRAKFIALARAATKLLGSGRDARRAMIFHLGRSGSTVLTRMLADFSTHCDGEILESYISRNLAWPWNRFEESYDSGAEMDFDSYLAKRIRSAYSASYVGEIKPFQLRICGISLEDSIAACRRQGLETFVLLDRRNRLRIVASAVRALQTGLWHTNQETRSAPLQLPLERVEFDRSILSLYDCLQKLDSEWNSVLNAIPSPRLRLSYEDDIESDPARAASELSTLFGKDRFKPPGLARTSTGPLARQISNWKEVVAYLKGSEYEWMTEE